MQFAHALHWLPLLLAALGVFVSAHSATGLFAPVDTRKVPIERLLKNLAAQAEKNPEDFQTRYALARVHSMAYAVQLEEFPVDSRTEEPFFGQGTAPNLPPRIVARSESESSREKGREHLNAAVKHYRRALELNEQHLPSRLGLAWCLDQAGRKSEAVKEYRKALELAWAKEKNSDSFFEVSMTEETARYLLPLLDKEADAREIQKIEAMLQTTATKPRTVTPILIPLGTRTDLSDLIATDRTVPFDLDGSGRLRSWQWITPDAGWLVFDQPKQGRISSGLQLLGSVAFWVFWTNGYQALGALDDDGNGLIEGPELEGLAVWRDLNSDGVSDSGEVQSVNHWGITDIACGHEPHPAGIAFNPAGVRFKDGTVRPTYDWTPMARPERNTGE